MRKIFKSFLFICLAIILSSAFLFAYNPPNYLHTFYGDATGDMLLQVDDIPTHKQYAASGAASYNTTQPQTSSQYWNTCDMTGDNLCQVDDIPSLKQVASGNTISVSLTSWHIDNWNLPLSGNASGSFIPFQLNVQATGGTLVGRPGIIMKVTIDPIGSTTTGLLQGRSCSSGDLHEAGATCAIGVSVTDMADPNNSVGLTESASSTTLQVKANGFGTLHLHVETVAQPLLNIPAMTLDLYPVFPDPCAFISIDCSNPGPNPVNELAAMQCAVISTCSGSPVIDTGVDTCGGTVSGTGPWTYDFTPTEAQGPGTCVAGVMDSVENYFKSNGDIRVNEVNVAPTITVDCPASANETDGITCPLTASDTDLPLQTLSCSIASCTGGGSDQTVTIGEGTTDTNTALGATSDDERSQVIYLASEIGGAGTISSLAINVTQLPGQTLNNFTIRMKHTSLSYYSTSSWEAPSGWTTVYQNNLTITSLGWNTFTFTTPFSYNGTNNLMVDFSFNNASHSTNGLCKNTSGSSYRHIYRRFNSTEGDPLTWTGTTPSPSRSKYTPNIKLGLGTGLGSCVGATLSGCSSLYIPSQGENSGPGTIHVSVNVQDSYSATGLGSDSVAILEVNMPPTDSAPATVTGNELSAISFTVSKSDPDIPVQTLTCEMVSNACPAGTLSSCVWSWTPTEAQGPTSCDVVTRVYDGVAYSSNVTTHVKVNEVNVAPVDNATTSVSGTVLNPISFDINPTDSDIPTQTLTCSQVSNACSGGTLTGCTWSWTPGSADGPTSCNVVTRVYDGVAYSSNKTTKIIVTNDNTAPINNAPASVSGTVLNPISFDINPTDSDIPPQTLTCSQVSNACPGGTLTGCTWSWTPGSADGPTSCNVVTRVYDGMAYSSNKTTKIIVTDGSNTAPSITVDCPASANETDSITCPLTASDADLPAQSLTCSLASCTLGVEQAVTIGDGTTNRYYFIFGTNYHDERTQVIYLASEIGTAGVITSLAINSVYQLPGQTMKNFTIRIKHTSLSSYSTKSWEAPSGWTTVYQNNLTITSLGWNTLAFTTPFSYNGTDNLMVDFSFNNDSSSTEGYIKSTNRSTYRTIYHHSNSSDGDPLNWTGTTPTSNNDSYTPDIRLGIDRNGNCVGATLTGCSSLFIPSQGETSVPGKMNVSVSVQDSIGATGLGSDSVAILEVNTPPVNNAQASVTGNELTTIALATPTDSDIPAQILTSSVVSATGACVNGASSGNTWFWTPTEADGPTSCDVVTRVYDGVAYSSNVTTHVKVSEVNVAPVDNAPVSVSGTVLNPISFDINPTDSDIPTQTLTCEQVSNACSGGTLTDCSWSWTPATIDGPTSCNVVTRVYDGVAYSSNKTTKIIVTDGGNTTPTDNAPATVTGDELTAISFDTNPTDPESPPQTLTSLIVSRTGACANGTLYSHTFTWTPTEAQGPTSCNVVTRVFDGVAYSSNVTTKIIVNEANQPPVWSTAPTDISVIFGQSYSNNNGVATDPDLPSQILTCSKASQTCSFNITVSGSGTSPRSCGISFTAADVAETCDLEIQATDPYAGSVTDTIQIVVRVPTIWYVDASATGSGTGTSWANAFTKIQTGVNAATSGDMVWVAEGNYSTTGTASVLTMKSGVEIYGGFVGYETSLSQRLDPADYPTTLDGKNTSSHVVVGASNARLDGFYITGGAGSYGGGMYNNYVLKNNLIIANSIFIGNTASYGGGGIANYDSSPTITNCVFSGNSASRDGGGIYNDGSATMDYYASSPTITNCVFSGNSASGYGGGVYTAGSTYPLGEVASPVITNCVFSGNSRYGIYISGSYSTATITNTIMWGDTPSEYYCGDGCTINYSDIQGYGPYGTNIKSDPLFVSSTDFHLQSSSPCINTGTNTGAPAYDLDGNPRPSPVGGIVDMGAYEYQFP